MNILRALLLLVLAGGVAAAQNASAHQPDASPTRDPPQKAEPNQQIPATPEANSGAANSPTPATVTPPVAANNADLQGAIQQGLRNDSSLDASRISVNVTDSSIELSGTVGSSKDKQTAQRVAQSFDGNRKFTDNLMVAGQAPGQGNAARQAAGTARTLKQR